MELHKVTVEYIVEGKTGDFMKETIFACELPPEGRTIILYKTKFEVISVEHDLDEGTAKIFLSDD